MNNIKLFNGDEINQKTILGHPSGLFTLFFTEMWVSPHLVTALCSSIDLDYSIKTKTSYK